MLNDDLPALERDGFFMARGLVPPGWVAALRDAVAPAPGGSGARRRNGARYAMRGLAGSVPLVAELAELVWIRALVSSALGTAGLLVRSILFDKPAGANWRVGWHQDTTIAVTERHEEPGFGPWSVKAGVPHVRPPAALLDRMVTLRIHLDDARHDHGALCVVPGSHRGGILSGSAIETMSTGRKRVTCEASAGDVLLMRPLLLHASAPCETPGHRRVIHLEYASSPLPGKLLWARY